MFSRKEINFVGNKNRFFIFSLCMIVLVIIFTFIFGVDLDIRFKGGTLYSYSYEGELGAVSLDEVDKLTEDILGEQVTLAEKYNKLTDTNGFEITLSGNKSVDSEKQMELNNAILEKFADQNVKQLSITTVSASMGKLFFVKCLIAVGLGSLLMIVYIALRFKKISGWSAGVMAVLALIHDIIIVYGTFVIFKIPLDDSFIAVVLTILGYSVNDTIVIYDRIRENKNLYQKKMPIGQIVNMSINQTLARSINTSLMTVLAMVVVCIVAAAMGVSSILSFAFPMIMGLVCGAYSSICIASPLWVVWQNYKEKHPKKKKASGKKK